MVTFFFFMEGTCHLSRLYESAGLKDGGLKGNSQWAWLKRLYHRLPSASHLGFWLRRWNLNVQISDDPSVLLNTPFYTCYVFLAILLAAGSCHLCLSALSSFQSLVFVCLQASLASPESLWLGLWGRLLIERLGSSHSWPVELAWFHWIMKWNVYPAL